MKIAVIGSGGVGGYFGGRLAQSGQAVTFIVRPRHAAVIRLQGLRVDSINGNFVCRPQVCEDAAACGPVDLVIVAVKSWQVPEVARGMAPLLHQHTAVLPLQNGVDACEQLSEILGGHHVLGGLCRIISALVEPGHIRHSGVEPYIELGELDNRQSSRIKEICTVLSQAGIQVKVPANIVKAMWEKLLFLAAWSALGAITRASIGVIRSLPETRAVMVAVMSEIVNVAQAKGVPLDAESLAVACRFIDSLPEHGTASMQRDIMAGLPSELDGQLGTVVRLGKQLGVTTPVSSVIYGCLLPAERSARLGVTVS